MKDGGSDRFPSTASEALSAWSMEQEKSVKSPMERGRWRVTSEIGEMQVGDRVPVPFLRAAWRAVRVSRCEDLGRAAKGLSTG